MHQVLHRSIVSRWSIPSHIAAHNRPTHLSSSDFAREGHESYWGRPRHPGFGHEICPYLFEVTGISRRLRPHLTWWNFLEKGRLYDDERAAMSSRSRTGLAFYLLRVAQGYLAELAQGLAPNIAIAPFHGIFQTIQVEKDKTIFLQVYDIRRVFGSRRFGVWSGGDPAVVISWARVRPSLPRLPGLPQRPTNKADISFPTGTGPDQE